MTVLPIAYAQLIRLASLVFLLAFPFAYVAQIGHYILLHCFVINVLYFTIDE